MTIYSQLLEREDEQNPIKVGIIGAGQMGYGMVSQIAHIPGMIVVGISDINLENAEKARASFNEASEEKIDIEISENFEDIIYSKKPEIIVDATGIPEVGAQIAFQTLLAKKHLVLLNVEVDVTIGPIMKKLYNSANLVYTGSDGDEPAVTLGLFEFAKSMGLEVLVAGKGKNNPLIPTANPDTAQEEATEKGMSPHMLAAFQDGTKTMAEMTLLSNATGFKSDKVGMHGISGDLDSVLEDLNTKENNGVLEKFQVVEYVDGLAPGVFIIVKGKNLGVANELDYLLKKGKRNHHILYRPFHLASLETPITIAKAVLNEDYAIVPIGAPVSETVAVAKKDIKSGEPIDGIGGYCIRGVMESSEEQKENNHLPIGIIAGKTIAKKDISYGTFLTEDDVEVDKNTTVWKLRELQNKTFN
ncbi:NAD(P)-dependent oxidoreductase [Staphylococcus cohnii]|uniref:NAD(P)H-dependent oxidoreductase n=1 Tax=Staphylococcus cohnii TaxID=29382 RepID=UPI000D1A137D|nr:Gfo/Idh/MocA family oxidoreductase [Staphylococcus cohnii]PTF25479.1 NAD(P)-dependent oxidoreductase [Staphylococcus cohnii]PTF28840.1 NAD(P)-dependent oxidoreductase [Staphylococcus cohnii]PTG46918.1 NAD(P)-dependent oxidoreductase [Staphylococcus cohnii]RIL86555.1 NAD(P)-dependent oxidoreductase [Staphylococcus cohnii]